MPTSPSNAGATTADASPSNNTASGEINETLSTELRFLRHLVGLLHDFFDRARHIERLLRQLVELARNEPLERRDGLLELHVLPRNSSELLGHRKRLRHEPLESTGSADDELVFLGELVHSKNRDDVLELLVPLENPLNVGRNLVMS